MGNCCNSYRAPSCSKDVIRCHSFEWRGPWNEGVYYYNDDYVTDFVSYGNVILACAKNHLSDADSEPVIIYDGKTAIGVDSEYWSFVLCATGGNDWDDLAFKVENNVLYYSVDGGETFIEVGNVGVPIVDNLSSTATDQALSANQGRILNDRISALPEPVTVVNNLTTDSALSALSAAQGKVLKGLVDNAVLYVEQNLTDAQKLRARRNINVRPTESSAPSGGMKPNVLYELGTISGATAFNCAAAQNGEYAHYYFVFETGNEAPTITWPSVLDTWGNGQIPLISANKHYEVSILDGVGLFIESSIV